MIADIKTSLVNDLELFFLAYGHFLWSIEECSDIHISHDATEKTLEQVEALTARFERLVDLFIMKITKTIELYETGLNEGTVRDRLQLMEKLGIVTNSNERIQMRSMRNIIAHEYFYQNLQELKEKIEDECVPVIQKTVDEIKKRKNG